MILTFKTVRKTADAEHIAKKSRFIATVAPVSGEEEALLFFEDIKKKYANATHNCPAYRVELNPVKERQSDDGEPSGTAGLPMLNVLRKEEITDVAVVVTRYFGGTLLGTGGLVHAYTAACKEGLKSAGIRVMNLMRQYTVQISYTLLGKVEYKIRDCDFEIFDIAYEGDVRIQVWTDSDRDMEFEELVIQSTAATAVIVKGDLCYREKGQG